MDTPEAQLYQHLLERCHMFDNDMNKAYLDKHSEIREAILNKIEEFNITEFAREISKD